MVRFPPVSWQRSALFRGSILAAVVQKARGWYNHGMRIMLCTD